MGKLRPARWAILAVLAVTAALLAPSSSWAWGCEGHQVIALIAKLHLHPHAAAEIARILGNSPIDPKLSRYCKNAPDDAMADASTWPDDIRSARPETGPWHYVDIPQGTSQFNQNEYANKFCEPKEGCVTLAITNDLETLRATPAAGVSPAVDEQNRAEALRFLIHFVGDLHQPLHGTTNNDQGGNCVPVSYFDEAPKSRNRSLETYTPNLHLVWDATILDHATRGETPEQVADELNRSFRRKIRRWSREHSDVNQWAWESYQLSQKNVYGALPVPIPVETPVPMKSCADDNHVGARMLELHEQLGQSYQDAALPIVRERLAQAGARLAMLLNQLWP